MHLMVISVNRVYLAQSLPIVRRGDDFAFMEIKIEKKR